ncbi:cell division protein ZapA [Spirosoma luteolum]
MPIRVKIAGLHYTIFVEPESEGFVRDAAVLLQTLLDEQASEGVQNPREAMMRVAFDGLVNKLRNEQQVQQLQQMLFKRITQLDRAVSSTG